MSQQPEIIYVPPTTTKTVVFPLKRETNTFFTDFYSPELTGDQVSREEVDQFISKILIASQSRFQSSPTEPGDNRCKRGALVFLGSLIGLYILMKTCSETLSDGEIICLILFMLQWALFLCCWCTCYGPSERALNSIAPKLNYQDVADEHNEILRSRDWRWNLSGFPTWIELTKDLKKQINEFQVETEEKITFHVIQGRYSKAFYEPEMTDGRISHEEMYQFISQINLDLRRPLESRNCGWESWAGLLFFDAWFFPLMEFLKHYPDLLSDFQTTVIVLAFIIITVAVGIYYCKIEDKKSKAELLVRSQRLAGEFNETLRSKGLGWDVPNKTPIQFDLYKNYRNQNFSNQQIEIPLYSQERNSNQRLGNNMYAPLAEIKED